jgi:hypothetical protein
MTKQTWLLRKTLFSLTAPLLALACMGPSHAAERTRFDELPNRLAPFGTVLAYRAFNVVTLDGKAHDGRRLRLEKDHVRIFKNEAYEDLPGDQIARIEIRQTWRFVHHIAEAAELPIAVAALACGGPGSDNASPVCMVPVAALFSPAWAYTAVTAPFFLASDGVASLIPPKVFEIVH